MHPPAQQLTTQRRQPTTHQFSRAFAREHGIKEAILCGYLAHRINYTGKREGEGYRCTLDDLKYHYPYLTRTAIADALDRLCRNGVLNRHHHNYRPGDRTTHYAFANPEKRTQAASDPIYFGINAAVRHGLNAALILTNLRMRLEDEAKRGRLGKRYRVSARVLAKHLPLSRSVISRTLNRLAAGKVLPLHPGAGLDHAYEVDVAIFLGHEPNPDFTGPKPDMDDAIPDMDDSKPDADDPNPDMYNTLEVDVQSSRSKSGVGSSNRYEARPAAPSAGRACSMKPSGSLTICQPEPKDGAGRATTPVRPLLAQLSGAMGIEAPWAKGESAASNSVDEHGRLVFPVFTIPDFPRLPLPGTFAELLASNQQEWQGLAEDHHAILRRVRAKVAALVDHLGVGVMFRWTGIKEDEKLFRVIKEAVTRFHCSATDNIPFGNQRGVDRYAVEWLWGACRAYLAEYYEDASVAVKTIYSDLRDGWRDYFQQHRAELTAEGLGHLRCGQDIHEELSISPDAELEDDAHRTPAEKTRIFHNGVRAMNRRGKWEYFSSCSVRAFDFMTVTRKGLKLTRELFALNPQLTPATLLNVLDVCIETALQTRNQHGYREDFAVLRANDLTYFIKHLEPIANIIRFNERLKGVRFLEHWDLAEAA